MKNVREVKVPAKTVKATTRTVETITCDIDGCGVKITSTGYGYHGRCDICKRDLCRKHTTYDPDEPGDYPDNYCPICTDLLIPARREMNERHWEEEEALISKVKKESLNG